ncbi:uncharacterized protein DNG_04684 [Cephalotrichum gorgonifer]|uniref:Uncharacterized protein n=1 Tax=Cephalotrichum gorgonifer TaxID=2041049 RepID=A0AAE8SUT1_9PEZI|nr:uncharacterized protein DNG_04684 [Cephalotrichum gorgonifer]
MQKLQLAAGPLQRPRGKTVPQLRGRTGRLRAVAINERKVSLEEEAGTSSEYCGIAVEKLDKAGIANASVNYMRGVWDHPQLRARGRWTEIDTSAGAYRLWFLPVCPHPG